VTEVAVALLVTSMSGASAVTVTVWASVPTRIVIAMRGEVVSVARTLRVMADSIPASEAVTV
jgi:hypothetical protein